MVDISSVWKAYKHITKIVDKQSHLTTPNMKTKMIEMTGRYKIFRQFDRPEADPLPQQFRLILLH
jgi:hypothetical protein